MAIIPDVPKSEVSLLRFNQSVRKSVTDANKQLDGLKTPINYLASDASLADVVAKLNEIIAVLTPR